LFLIEQHLFTRNQIQQMPRQFSGARDGHGISSKETMVLLNAILFTTPAERVSDVGICAAGLKVASRLILKLPRRAGLRRPQAV
jgi:hypothetical protein